MSNLANLTRDKTWGIAQSAFTNPMYLQAPAGTSGNSQSTGFEIEQAATLVVAFEGTYTGVTLVHQQTLDPSGAAGWFDVEGVPSNGGSASSAGSTSSL